MGGEGERGGEKTDSTNPQMGTAIVGLRTWDAPRLSIENTRARREYRNGFLYFHSQPRLGIRALVIRHRVILADHLKFSTPHDKFQSLICDKGVHTPIRVPLRRTRPHYSISDAGLAVENVNRKKNSTRRTATSPRARDP